VNGFDIAKDMDLVRRSLGICPQNSILFESLTVEEHLVFFSKVCTVLWLCLSEIYLVQQWLNSLGCSYLDEKTQRALDNWMLHDNKDNIILN